MLCVAGDDPAGVHAHVETLFLFVLQFVLCVLQFVLCVLQCVLCVAGDDPAGVDV